MMRVGPIVEMQLGRGDVAGVSGEVYPEELRQWAENPEYYIAKQNLAELQASHDLLMQAYLMQIDAEKINRERYKEAVDAWANEIQNRSFFPEFPKLSDIFGDIFGWEGIAKFGVIGVVAVVALLFVFMIVLRVA